MKAPEKPKQEEYDEDGFLIDDELEEASASSSPAPNRGIGRTPAAAAVVAAGAVAVAASTSRPAAPTRQLSQSDEDEDDFVSPTFSYSSCLSPRPSQNAKGYSQSGTGGWGMMSGAKSAGPVYQSNEV